mmetsp:Transcript_33246/g.93216  ORF Transcript_33246/g.93216 Transcript_33246/m.93216 type:complete len:150 (+) Transcript_33246:192-641(+)
MPTSKPGPDTLGADCCDGSDEEAGRCGNTCEEEEAARRAKEERDGLVMKMHQEMIAEGKSYLDEATELFKEIDGTAGHIIDMCMNAIAYMDRYWKVAAAARSPLWKEYELLRNEGDRLVKDFWIEFAGKAKHPPGWEIDLEKLVPKWKL